jgi:hypothetical protein
MDTVNDDHTTERSGRGFLSGLFRQCDPDPKGSVSKSWSFTLLFIAIFVIVAITEGMNVN